MNTQLNIQNVLIVGLGQSSMACAQFLQRQGCVVSMFADTRSEPAMLPQFQSAFPQAEFVLADAFNTSVLVGVDALVLSPGFDPRHEVVKRAQKMKLQILGEVELFARLVDKPVIGITGTNGKSTVTVLTGELLKAAGFNVAVGGNLGTPTVELLQDDIDVYVLELSSFQLETTESLTLISATVLNVSDDHADRYNHFDDYVAAKLRIYKNAQLAVINKDDALLSECMPTCTQTSFSVKGEADYAYQDAQLKTPEMTLDCVNLKLSGLHNYANALVALALVSPLCELNEDIVSALNAFSGLPHRMQFVANVDGVDYINDSKATNVGATLAALEGLNQTVALIAGGVTKEQNFLPLRDAVQTFASELVLIGEDASELSNALDGVAPQYVAGDMREAIRYVHQQSIAGGEFDSVLLSPACASFDQYTGFEARGQDFIECVESLKNAADTRIGGCA